eukprot:6207315-Pleurochrysis_carterae.AAC.2
MVSGKRAHTGNVWKPARQSRARVPYTERRGHVYHGARRAQRHLLRNPFQRPSFSRCAQDRIPHRTHEERRFGEIEQSRVSSEGAHLEKDPQMRHHS